MRRGIFPSIRTCHIRKVISSIWMLPQGHFWGGEKCCVFLSCLLGQVQTPAHMGNEGDSASLGLPLHHEIHSSQQLKRSSQEGKSDTSPPLQIPPNTYSTSFRRRAVCTQGESTISFAAFGHYCQSWQLRSWREINLWPKSFIEISEISIKHPFFFFFFFFSRLISLVQTTR